MSNDSHVYQFPRTNFSVAMIGKSVAITDFLRERIHCAIPHITMERSADGRIYSIYEMVVDKDCFNRRVHIASY
jgi:hypothetical protein